MSEDLRRIKQQQEAQAAQLHKMQLQMQTQNARKPQHDTWEEPVVNHQPQHQQPQYQTVDQNQIIFNQLAQEAASRASLQVQAQADAQKKITDRMERLVNRFPDMRDEESALVVKARDVYQRIAEENPGLDEATRYELSVNEAATSLGIRPADISPYDFTGDYTMPSNSSNSSRTSQRRGKSRLTPAILENARLMGVNIDASTPEGKKNLAELEAYTVRFNADQDETAFRYK